MDMLLPQSVRREGHHVDVYSSGNLDVERDRIPPGCLLFMQAAGVGIPDLLSAFDIISNDLLDTPESDLPPADNAPTDLFLLLGSGFQQNLVTLVDGPVAPQILWECQAAEIIAWHQLGYPGVFDEMFIAG